MFERIKALYKRKGCTEEQINRFVALGKLTEAERDSILEEGNNAEHRQDEPRA